jgi:hypothetical protein
MQIKMKRHKFLLDVILVLFFSVHITKADLPEGKWHISGDVEDVRMSGGYSQRTNNLSFEGHYDSGRFLLDMVPHDSEEDIAESAGWDGNLFYMIQRYPITLGKGLARTESLGKIEPTVISRYSTYALTSVLLALADSNTLEYLQSGKDIFILGNLRRYPEENNTFKVSQTSTNVDIEAVCHGGEERNPAGIMIPIQGFEKGFTRWTYKSDLKMLNESNSVITSHYECFYPFGGKLFLERKVTGKFLLCSNNESISSFKPEILESKLLVDDYRYRAMLFPLSKGIVDQCWMYTLTNHSWDYDTNITYTHFKNLVLYLSGPGVTNSSLKDEPFSSIQIESKPIRRIILLITFLVFSVSFLGVILFNSWRATQKRKEQQQP